jgi:hypothetical protein
MTVKLFDQIALENEEEYFSGNDNYTDNVLALDNQLRGIDFAIEQISSLSKIKAILLKNKDRKPSRSSIKIGKLAVENVSKSLGLEHEISTIATEGFDGDNVSVESMVESIVDTIKKIWESIVRTFKSIWEKIMSFFSSNKPRVNNDASRAKRTEKDFKDIQEEIKRNEIVLPVSNLIDLTQFTAPINYLNKELSDTDLLDHIEIISNLGKQLKLFIDTVEETHSVINQTIQTVADFMDQDPVGGSNIYTAAQTMFDGLYHYIQNLPKLDDSQQQLREKLNDVVAADTKVDSNSVRIFNKLNYGAGICFYTLVNEIHPPIYKISVIPNCTNDHDQVRFKVPDVTNIDLYSVKIVTLTGDVKELSEHIDNKIKSIKNLHTKIMSFLEVNQKNINESNEDILVRNFNYIRQMTTTILELATNTAKSFEEYFKTVHYFAELNEYFKRHYQEAIKKATT